MPSAADTTLRHADPARDGAACAAIYAPYVAQGAASFEEVVLDATQFAERIAATTRTHPWLVLEGAGRARLRLRPGAWRDVAWLQLDLGGNGPPAEPLGPQRLPDSG